MLNQGVFVFEILITEKGQTALHVAVTGLRKNVAVRYISGIS